MLKLPSSLQKTLWIMSQGGIFGLNPAMDHWIVMALAERPCFSRTTPRLVSHPNIMPLVLASI
jgi:hypothetical protein